MMLVNRREVKRCKKCKTDGVDDILEAVRQPRLRFKYLQTASEDQPRLVSDHHRVHFQIFPNIYKYLQTASEDQPRLVSDHHRVQFQILTSN